MRSFNGCLQPANEGCNACTRAQPRLLIAHACPSGAPLPLQAQPPGFMQSVELAAHKVEASVGKAAVKIKSSLEKAVDVADSKLAQSGLRGIGGGGGGGHRGYARMGVGRGSEDDMSMQPILEPRRSQQLDGEEEEDEEQQER